MSNATLLVIQGIDQGARFELSGETVGIGRGVQNAVRILDTEVSRQHAVLHAESGRYVLTDRRSSNGTFVNGEPVGRQELRDGDQIQLGRTVLVFHAASGDDSRMAAERIDLLAHHDPDDRSSIIGTVDQRAGETLLRKSDAPTAQALSQTLANLQALYRISEVAVRPSLSLDDLLHRILELTIEVVGADRGCILLRDADSARITPHVFSDRRMDDAAARMPVSRSIVEYVLRNGQGVRTTDARHDRRFEAGQSILQAGICEAMCVPMQGHYELMGVVYVDTTTPPEQLLARNGPATTFSEDQLRLLVVIGRQTALAIENQRYQQALVKAERLAAMGQTIALLSHHIKNILQGVRGGSYLIDMGLGDHNEELVRKGWGIVEKNQNKIYNLVMDMLTFSKDRQPVMQVAALNDTVAEVCELMQIRAEECRVTFRCEPAADLPEAAFEPEGIHRAVLNIVTNAIDAVEGASDGTVLVQTGHDAATDTVFVAVTDNGPGIEEDQLGRIFNIFESTKGSRGTGLGLAVSQKIIREHGGEISVESRVGEGCRFTLAWPRFDEEHRGGESGTNG
ncbi:MAG: ATP-binding protein [Planctomycetaceae bacterium]